jgi:alkylation response protein AidB-like acyl-CoA dehydrogenase
MIRSPDHEILSETARRFVSERYRFEERRKLVASELGFSLENWRLMAELGWLGLPFAEASGGLGGSLEDLAVLMEAFGRALVLEPYLSTVVVAGGILEASGSEAQKRALVPEIAEGRMLLAFAHQEPRSRFDLASVETRALATGSGYRLDGRKALVEGAPAAHRLIVSARVEGERASPDGIGLFLVDRDAAGLTIHSYPTVDGRRAAEVELDGVEVGGDGVLGEPGGAHDIIDRVARGTITALGAEAVGSMGALVDSTRDYLRTRRQFGVPLATFQALQHRMVDMYVEYELSRALVFRAAASLPEEDSLEAWETASAIKVQVGTAGRHIGKEAIQLHGGMGMTSDLAVGHHFKRITAIDLALGTAEYHLSRLGGAPSRDEPPR